MLAYASRTGTRRNLDALRAAGWRILVSARGAHRAEGFENYAIDNGAWTSHQRGEPFDVRAFERVVDSLGDGSDWIVAPDIVAGGLASLALSAAWLPRLAGVGGGTLVAVQDGMEARHVDSLLVPGRVGIFVGGTTEWKWRTLPLWASLARRNGCQVHVGRVNSVRRILECARCGVDSFDGTSATRYAVNVRRLDAARRQGALSLG